VSLWLWEAPRPGRSGCGVSTDRARALRAARDCLISGQTTAALAQAAELVSGSSTLATHHRRIGGSWQVRRTRSRAIRWHMPAVLAAG
jgi:hypothetical protein